MARPEGVVAAERQVRHRAGTGSRDTVGRGLRQGAKEDIDDALRGFDVAAGDRGGRVALFTWIVPSGAKSTIGAQQPFVRRNGFRGEAFHYIEGGRQK